jgi:hypothetical protein
MEADPVSKTLFFSSFLNTGWSTVQKPSNSEYLVIFHVDIMMVALRNIANEVFRVQQKAKKKPVTSVDIWKINHITF